MPKHDAHHAEFGSPAGVVEPVIEELLADRLADYKGQWVAIDQARSAVVASGDSAQDVVRLALAKGFTDPLVFRVPVHADRLNLL